MSQNRHLSILTSIIFIIYINLTQVNKLRAEMASRTQRHVHILAALQANIRQLALEATDAREIRYSILEVSFLKYRHNCSNCH